MLQNLPKHRQYTRMSKPKESSDRPPLPHPRERERVTTSREGAQRQIQNVKQAAVPAYQRSAAEPHAGFELT